MVDQDELDMRLFCEEICREIENGYGFVPLIGAGVSVASGIPTGDEIRKYLGRCARRAAEGSWEPQLAKWPSLNETLYGDLKALTDSTSSGSRGPLTPQQWETLADVSGWPITLEMLSRLRVGEAGHCYFGPHQNHIVDSFFVHITRDRHPSVAHLMLAHLADALRVRTVLTTNFDDLIEQAFKQVGIPLTTFDVHSNAGLPSAELVLAQRSIVKLHGGRYGLRADASLDECPSESDRTAFQKYFGTLPPLPAKGSGQHTPPNPRRHLLVLGVKGDRRTLILIQHAMDRLPDLQVYWVCHRQSSIARTRKMLFEDPCAAQFRGRIHFAYQHDPAPFLFELYQRIYYALPPGGTNYPAFWHVPPAPYFSKERQEHFRIHQKNLTDNIRSLLPMERTPFAYPNTPRYSEPPVLVVDGHLGVTSVASHAFDDLSNDFHCLWVELDDFCGHSEVFVHLLEDAARKIDVPASSPLLPAVQSLPFKQYLAECVTHSSRPFVVFLNGRDGPGVNSGLRPLGNEQARKGWSEKDVVEFGAFLNEVRQPNVLFVLLTREDRGIFPYIQLLFEHTRNGSLPHSLFSPDSNHLQRLWMEEASLNYDKEEIVSELMNQLETDDDRNRRFKKFLYALTLFRHSRYLAAAASWTVLPGEPHLENEGVMRTQTTEEYLVRLAELRVIRYKPGGFAWMHQEVRETLRPELENDLALNLRGLRAIYHQGIAGWYANLFRSSNDPAAAIESLYHRLCCIDHSWDSALGHDGAQHMRQSAYVEATVTLKLARERILACGHLKSESNLIQQLAQRPHPASPEDSHFAAALELHRTCNEILRDYAAEVADYGAAINRNEREEIPVPWSGRTGHHPKLKELEQTYRKAVYYTGLRSYNTASAAFEYVLLELNPDFQQVMNLRDSENLTSGTIEEARRIGRAWANISSDRSIADLKLVIQSLGRYLFLQMLVAQVNSMRQSPSEENPLLRFCEVLYVYATEVMRYMDDADFLQKANAYIRTQFGVLLAKLGRFQEAHRRLNEALGYMSKTVAKGDSRLPAIIELRRAETYLLQLTKHVEGHDSHLYTETGATPGEHRIAFGLIENVHFSLEQAETNLAGLRRSVWWWTWLYDMQLSVCVLVSKLGCCGSSTAGEFPAVCHRCPQWGHRVLEIAHKETRLIQWDVLRQTRLAELLMKFLGNVRPSKRRVENREQWGNVVAALFSAREGIIQVRDARENDIKNKEPACDLDDGIAEYVQRILRETEDFLLPFLPDLDEPAIRRIQAAKS